MIFDKAGLFVEISLAVHTATFSMHTDKNTVCKVSLLRLQCKRHDFCTHL